MKHTTHSMRDKRALVLKIGLNNTKPQHNYSGEKENEEKGAKFPRSKLSSLASWTLDKPIYLRLHHKQLPVLQYFGPTLDWPHNAKGRQKLQADNPWPFLCLLKDTLAGTAGSQADNKVVQSLRPDCQQCNSADSQAITDCFSLCSVQATAFTSFCS